LPEPAVKLYGYQKRWLADTSRFKLGRWSRQAGKSFVCALEPALDGAGQPMPWVILSRGERQSKEVIEKVRMHAQAIGAVADFFEYDWVGEAVYKALEVRYPNGTRIIGLPANPDTARGFSANVILDEFAFHKDSRKIWSALFPVITRGYRLRVISTPMGKQNKFYELATGDKFSQHVVDIYQAIADGLELRDEDGNPTTPEELRQALADDEAWHQEYLVEFLDEATAFLSYDLIETVEDSRVEVCPPWAQKLLELAIAHHAETKHLESPPPFDASEALAGVTFEGDLYLGFDVARLRDLSVIWLDEIVPGLAAISRAVMNLAKQPFGVQERVLHALLRLCRRACIDKTGIGEQLAEKAIELFGESRVEGVDFTPANKEALAGGLKTSFEDRRDRIPADQQIRQALHAVKRLSTPTGHFRFDAERSEQTGHADHFWGKALAVMARSNPVGPIEHQSVAKRRFAEQRGAY